MTAWRAALMASLSACAAVDGRPPAPTPRAAAPSASSAPGSGGAPPAATGLRGPPLAAMDLGSLDEPTMVWSHATNGAEPRRTARGVWVLEPDGARATLLDPATGATVAGAEVAAGERGTLVGGGRAGPTFVAGGGETFARLGASGGVTWRARDVGHDARVSTDGSAMSERVARCATGLRDADTGRAIPRSFADSLVQMRGHGDMAPGTMCRTSTWVQLARRGITLVAHGLYRRDAALSGVARDGALRYTVALGDAHPRLVHADDERATFVVLGHEVSALSLHVPSGRVVWRRVVADAERCLRRDGGAYFAEATAAAPPRFMLRACGLAQLIDVASGATAWTREVGADAAFVVGAETEPWDESREVAASNSPAVRALSLDGREVARAPLPTGARDVTPLAGGWVATTVGLDGATLIEPDGRARWSVAVAFGNSFVRGGTFVALVSGAPIAVAVDGATGRRFAVRDAGPWVLGDAGGRWLTTKLAPPRLVALAR